jgi:hypothetical protein
LDLKMQKWFSHVAWPTGQRICLKNRRS